MRNLSFLFISILALALFSCRKEESKLTNGLLTITATQKSDPGLKTNIGAAGTTAVTWNANDQLALFDGAGNVNKPFTLSSSADSKWATFTGTIDDWSSGSKTFYAVYPYNAANGAADPAAYPITIPQTQIQDFTSGNTYNHLGLYDYLAAPPKTIEYAGKSTLADNFNFEHLMAVLDIEVGNLTGGAVTVSQISILRDADDFAQTAILDLTKIHGQNYQRGTVTNRLDLNVQDAGSTDDKGIFTGSMIIAPADLSGGNTSFVVTVAGGAHYDVTKTFGPNLLAGKRYKVLITIGSPGFIDTRDDKVYKTVTIGTQTWMAENLVYLPAVYLNSNQSGSELRYYVMHYYDTDVPAAKLTANYGTYGVLYNWPAALVACPLGWKLPSDAEWTTLTTYLGGLSVAGGKMKETGTTHWWNPNTGATNSSGFTALPGGYLGNGGSFSYLLDFAWFWSSSWDGTYSGYRNLRYNDTNVEQGYQPGWYGFSVRCLKDN